MMPQTLERPTERIAPQISSAAQDRLWISQTLSGHHEAYAHLMNKYKGPIFDLACRVLKDRCQAEDVIQDAFLRAYQHLNRFRYESKFSTWIYAIVMNGMRNYLRRTKIVRWSSLDALRLNEDDDYCPEMQHYEPAIDVNVGRKMEIEAIERMITLIPLRYQSIFTMHYFQNLSLQEIADTIGRPLGTVKVYLHRSRKLLYAAFHRHPARTIPA